MTALRRALSPRSVAALWLDAEFLKLWSATTASLFGTAFARIAIPLIGAVSLDASPRQVALAASLELMPFLLFGAFVGVWVDRLSQKRIMVVTHFGRALLVGSVPLASALGVLSMDVLYAAAFGIGILALFFEVTHQSFVPAVVDRARLVDANSRLQISRSAAEMSGPGMAGAVAQLVSAPLALVVDAVAFVGAAVCTIAMRTRDVRPSRPREHVRTELREGLACVFRNRILVGVAGSSTALYFFVASLSAVIILFATRDLRLSPAAVGLAFTVGSVGTLVAAFVNGPLTARFGLGHVLAAGGVVGGLSPLPLVVATHSTGLPLLILTELLLGVGASIFGIAQVTLRQSITPQRLQGRMNGTMRFVGVGGQAVGGLLAGVVAQAIGLRTTIGLGAIGAVLALAFVALTPILGLESVPAEPDEAGAQADAQEPSPPPTPAAPPRTPRVEDVSSRV